MFTEILLAVEEHQAEGGFLAEYWSILTDPAHIAVEFTFLVVFDIILAGLLWPLAKRFLDAMLRGQHEQYDREHGIHHHGDHVHIDPEKVFSHNDHPDHE